jgi:hypothetical protein
MPNADEPRDTGESPIDRMTRLGRALFAVKQDEIAKRESPKHPRRPKPKRA